MDGFNVEDLWNKEVRTESGRHVGRIEAIAIERDGTAHRVGVRPEAGSRRLTFLSLTGARLSKGDVIVADAPLLRVAAANA